MKWSICYVTARIEIKHSDDKKPEEVLENMHYDFRASDNDTPAKITETELTDWEVRFTE